MKTIKSLKDITTLEIGDVVIFGDLEYKVHHEDGYFLSTLNVRNDKIFTNLNISKKDFVKNLGINTLPINWDFPEVCSLEALTAIVSALFKEYEKQNELPKTWEKHCVLHAEKCTKVYFIDGNSQIRSHYHSKNHPFSNRNLCQTKKDAEAFLALMQLRALWHNYVGDFKFNWAANCYFCIYQNDHNQLIVNTRTFPHLFCFPTKELAEKFLTNFKDLFEIAKPLM